MPKYSDPADRYDAQENYQDDDMDDVLYNNKNTNSQEYPVACYDNYRVMLPYTQSSTWDGHTYPIVDGSEFAIPSKYWLIGGYEPGTEVSHINIENVRINDPYPKNQPDKYPYWDNLGADWFYGGIWVYRDKYSAGHPNVWKEDKEYKWAE